MFDLSSPAFWSRLFTDRNLNQIDPARHIPRAFHNRGACRNAKFRHMVVACVLLGLAFLGRASSLEYTMTGITTVNGKPVRGDFDGDGRDDPAVYDSTQGKWQIMYSSTNQFHMVNHHVGNNYVGVRGDYNGDGRDDFAIYVPWGHWWVMSATGGWITSTPGQLYTDWGSTAGQAPDFWGDSGMDPVAGDYNGDGKADLAVYQRSTGNWFIRSATIGEAYLFGENWGNSSMRPVPGDYNGDGKSDLAVHEAATGNWYIRQVAPALILFGESWGMNMIPVTGDFNGNGKSDLAVFDPSSQKWYIRSVTHQLILFGFKWGEPGEIPTSGDFNGNGVTDLATYNPVTKKFRINFMPLSPEYDNDGDGISNHAEIHRYGTDPNNEDTDGDGVSDYDELFIFGTDPNHPDSFLRLPIVEMPLDQNAVDLSGTVIATAVDSPTHAAGAGILGGALLLNGTTQRVSLSNAPILNSKGPYRVRTVSLWFKPDPAQNGRRVLYHAGGADRGMNIYLDNQTLYAGAWDLVLDTAANDQAVWPGSWQSVELPPGNHWHHVTLMLDAREQPGMPTPGTFHAYLNGAPFTHGSTQGMQIYSHGNTILGSNHGETRMHDGLTSQPHPYAGLLDEFTVWNSVFDTETIGGIYDKDLYFWLMKHFHHTHVDLDLDHDNDGLSTLQEYYLGTDPTNPDTDGDGLTDGDEVNVYGTNPLNPDTDGDGMPDGFEVQHGLNPLIDDAGEDPDEDGLTNLQEYLMGTDPNNPDTDGDGLSDWDEIHVHGTDPTNPDTDGDGLSDAEEVNIYGTDPTIDESQDLSQRENFTYDDRGWMTGYQTGTETDVTYTFDPEGNILSSQ